MVAVGSKIISTTSRIGTRRPNILMMLFVPEYGISTHVYANATCALKDVSAYGFSESAPVGRVFVLDEPQGRYDVGKAFVLPPGSPALGNRHLALVDGSPAVFVFLGDGRH